MSDAFANIPSIINPSIDKVWTCFCRLHVPNCKLNLCGHRPFIIGQRVISLHHSIVLNCDKRILRVLAEPV